MGAGPFLWVCLVWRYRGARASLSAAGELLRATLKLLVASVILGGILLAAFLVWLARDSYVHAYDLVIRPEFPTRAVVHHFDFRVIVEGGQAVCDWDFTTRYPRGDAEFARWGDAYLNSNGARAYAAGPWLTWRGLNLSQAAVLKGVAILPLGVPLSVALLPAAMSGIVMVWGRARRRTSEHLNLCKRCGYDLRATPERCPECGLRPEKT